jgi:hypothetical protein
MLISILEHVNITIISYDAVERAYTQKR